MTSRHHFHSTVTQNCQNLTQFQQCNSVRVHLCAYVPHWKVLKHFIYVQYGCGNQSKVVYSLGSTTTGSALSGNRSVTSSVTSTQKMWTLAAPQIRKWSFFFNQTFRISYWHLVEQIETLRGGIGAIWKKHIFSTGPPIVSGVPCAHQNKIRYIFAQANDDNDEKSSRLLHPPIKKYKNQTIMVTMAGGKWRGAWGRWGG
jgi:hypothetical protein